MLSAADAEAAHAALQAGGAYDIVVVSLSLGQDRVASLLERASRLRPGVPAIVLAVDPDPIVLQTRADHVVLEKPYSIDDVALLARRLSWRSQSGQAAPSGILQGADHDPCA